MNPTNREWKELDLNVDVSILPKNPTKLRLLADQNIPIEIVNDFKEHNIALISIHDLKLAGQPDENILHAAKRLKRVLLTTDKDFWDDKKHPLRQSSGIFCINAGPQDTDSIYRAFINFNYRVARFFDNEFWHETKVLLKVSSYTIKNINYRGAIDEIEYKSVGGTLYVREIRSSGGD